MEEYIVFLILIILLIIGVIYSVKHFKGESGCCGNGNYKPKRKKLERIIYKKQFKVSGMHCEHCKRRIEEVVNDIKGVSCKVDLRKKTLYVSYAENIDDNIIISEIKKAGYEIV